MMATGPHTVTASSVLVAAALGCLLLVPGFPAKKITKSQTFDIYEALSTTLRISSRILGIQAPTPQYVARQIIQLLHPKAVRKENGTDTGNGTIGNPLILQHDDADVRGESILSPHFGVYALLNDALSQSAKHCELGEIYDRATAKCREDFDDY